jgi:hypothetical protein
MISRMPRSNRSRRCTTAFRCAGQIEKERGAVQLVQDHVDCSRDEAPELCLCRCGAADGVVEQFLQAVVGIFVAGEEDLFLVLEVVVEIPLLHVQRRGDLFNRGAVITEAAEGFGGAFQDVDAGRRLRIGIARPFPALRAAGLGAAPWGRG